jgi:hypothetical protein
MPRLSNNEVSDYVNDRKLFKTNAGTIWSDYIASDTDKRALYVVYSYDIHFPMYVYDAESSMWIGNSSRYSATTSKHQSCARPDGEIVWLDHDDMQRLVTERSYTNYVAWRMEVA